MLLIATFLGGFANLIVIVGYVVTATSGLANEEQGVATGLVTMSQQVGMTLGLPIMSAVVAAHTGTIHAGPVPVGITTAIAINAALCLVTAALIEIFLHGPARKEGSA